MTTTIDASAPAAEFVDSTPLLTDAPALRARAERDGFLFFRGLLPAAYVLEVRADLLGVVDRHGWRAPGQGPLGGRLDVDAVNRAVAAELRTDIGVTQEMYDDTQRLESVHRLPHHPNLLALYRTLFGDGRDVLVHPRHIVRMVTPHRGMVPTPVHQDFPLIQGTGNTWTCWFPAGDCPREMGGLTVLRGSHSHGYLPIQPAEGAGGIAAQLCPGEADWVSCDYRAGDVLTFPSFTVHKALPCRVPDQIRLSLDVRYQPADEVVEEKSLLPHCGLTWEQIYAGWQRDDIKYYWKRLPLRLTPWDPQFLQPGRRIC
ncbi:MAG TPA: phytanoyl-CoA dioxygenase family protein [Tepidisphaeraceae bacterium]|nr:phytanoyl-CoA dioxygenase family protein [Tepidisphaeraceae bacterium]